MNEQNRFEVLLEDVNVKFDTVMEYVRDIPEIKQRLVGVESDVSHIKNDMSLIKDIVKDHEGRISTLESAS